MSLPLRILIWLILFIGIAIFSYLKANEVAKFKRKKSIWPITDLMLYVGLRLATWGALLGALLGAIAIYQNG